MYEGNSFLGGPDFSSLAETPPPPPEKRPEILDDDDDDSVEEKPKSILEYLKKDSVKPEEKNEPIPEPAEKKSAEENETADAIDQDKENAPVANREMTGEEEQDAAVEIIDAREDSAHQELINSKTAEDETEALAASVYLDEAKQEIKAGKPVDEAIETAAKNALGEMGIEPAEVDPDNEEPAEPIPPVGAPEVVEPEDAEHDDSDDTTPPSGGAGSSGGGTTGGGSGGSSGSVPPHGGGGAGGTVPPYGGGGAGGRPGGGAGGPTGGGPGHGGGNTWAPNFANQAPASPSINPNRRVNTGGAVLAGGIVGYLLGRRRGRIKTEKKLMPIQRKLEKEVAELHGKIAWREASIRSLAREAVTKNPEIQDKIIERVKANHESKKSAKNKTESSLLDKKEAKNTQEKSATDHPEKFGKFAVNAERPSQSEAFKTPERQKPVDMMTIPELLMIAERIELEQSNLKKLYEANRLDYRGLRRIIRAYLRGERFDQLIKDNLLSPEKYSYAETLQKNVSTTVADPLGGAGTMLTSDQPQPLMPNMQNGYKDEISQPETISKSPVTHKNISSAGVISAVIVVAVAVLIFLLTR